MHKNMSLGSNGVDWVRSLRKILMQQYMSLGSNGEPGCIRWEKFQNNFMAQTCALIAPVQPVLQRVLCSNETLPNAPKHYETHTNMSLGSNGVDWVRLLQKNLMRHHGTNFCINCTNSTRFAPSFV